MRFILTFDGEIKAKSKKNEATHERRRCFHSQLKHLWNTNYLLKNWEIPDEVTTEELADIAVNEPNLANHLKRNPPLSRAADVLKRKPTRLKFFEYVPLVTKALDVETSIGVTLLHPMIEGTTADQDNIIKLLLDSLKTPQAPEQQPGDARPTADESPFYTLLEDDSLVSRIVSTREALLQPVNGKSIIERNDFRAIIEITINPRLPNPSNLIFYSSNLEAWDHKWKQQLPEAIQGLSNQELQSRATQCVIRIRVAATNFRAAGDARRRLVDGQYQGTSQRLRFEGYQIASQEETDRRHEEWLRVHRPLAIAIVEELERRLQIDETKKDIDRPMALKAHFLAGPRPIEDASNYIEYLARKLV